MLFAMSIDTIQSEYVFSLRKKRIYKKDRLQNQIWNRSVNFKNIRTEFILFDYIFGYNSFLSFCNLMVFMQNNAVCKSWYECKNKYNRNKSFDVFACPYFFDNIRNPRYCSLPLSSFKIFKINVFFCWQIGMMMIL